MVKEKKPNLKCNIMFQKESEYNVQDTRFTKVKIWLMHTGLNHNGTNFSKGSIKEAIPTLANTPILGFIEKDESGENDFSNHRSEIYFDENGVLKKNYLCQAYGVIPENNNAHFEKRLCDDGIEREFLVVDGLIWNKLSEGIDILNRDFCKAQSMELSEDYDGEFDDNYVFHFKKFQFYGACILGDKYEPAMENASIEITYSKLKDNVQEKIKEKMTIFNKSINGGIKMTKNENDENIQKEPVSNENNENAQVKDTGETKKEPNKEPVSNENNENAQVKDNKDNSENKKPENNYESEYISLKHEMAIKEKEKEIEKLKYELAKSEEEKHKIKEEFVSYKNLVELKEKYALIEEYAEMLEDLRDYQALKDEKILNSFSVNNLKKELDSLIGQRVKTQHSQYSKENDGSVAHYFNRENEIPYNISPYGSLVEELLNK